MTNQSPSATVDEKCKTCNGTGNEICDNPDHGLIMSSIGARVQHHANGCPGCGNDDLYRIKGTVCPDCNGTGILHPQQPTVDVEKQANEITDALMRHESLYGKLSRDFVFNMMVTALQEALRGTCTREDLANFANMISMSEDGSKYEGNTMNRLLSQYDTERGE